MPIEVKSKDGSKAPSWLKTGAAAQTATKEYEAKVQAAKDAADKPRRFWLDPDDMPEATITFLDGELNQFGLFEPLIWEHGGVQHNGRYDEFLCTKEIDGHCPICNAGDKNYLGAFFTIINRSDYTIQKGQNAGKVLKNRKQLFVAKPTTVKLLTKIAIKRGGLTGCTFEVSRGSDTDPRVGGMFDFVSKQELEEIAAEIKAQGLGGGEPALTAEKALEYTQPYNYGEVLTYYSADQLTEMGVGKPVQTIGKSHAAKTSVNKQELEDNL